MLEEFYVYFLNLPILGARLLLPWCDFLLVFNIKVKNNVLGVVE